MTNKRQDRKETPTMYIVEWDDHEGNRHEMFFDSREDAKIEAAKLEKSLTTLQ